VQLEKLIPREKNAKGPFLGSEKGRCKTEDFGMGGGGRGFALLGGDRGQSRGD